MWEAGRPVGPDGLPFIKEADSPQGASYHAREAAVPPGRRDGRDRDAPRAECAGTDVRRKNKQGVIPIPKWKTKRHSSERETLPTAYMYKAK